jgi:hypothetical protein
MHPGPSENPGVFGGGEQVGLTGRYKPWGSCCGEPPGKHAKGAKGWGRTGTDGKGKLLGPFLFFVDSFSGGFTATASPGLVTARKADLLPTPKNPWVFARPRVHLCF